MGYLEYVSKVFAWIFFYGIFQSEADDFWPPRPAILPLTNTRTGTVLTHRHLKIP